LTSEQTKRSIWTDICPLLLERIHSQLLKERNHHKVNTIDHWKQKMTTSPLLLGSSPNQEAHFTDIEIGVEKKL
jgi:hypothetical protein